MQFDHAPPPELGKVTQTGEHAVAGKRLLARANRKSQLRVGRSKETETETLERTFEMPHKLTPKQSEALRFIADGQVQNHRFGYGAWRITGPSHPSVVGKVISMGLAGWMKAPNSSDAQIAQLTAKGREALTATDSK